MLREITLTFAPKVLIFLALFSLRAFAFYWLINQGLTGFFEIPSITYFQALVFIILFDVIRGV